MRRQITSGTRPVQVVTVSQLLQWPKIRQEVQALQQLYTLGGLKFLVFYSQFTP